MRPYQYTKVDSQAAFVEHYMMRERGKKVASASFLLFGLSLFSYVGGYYFLWSSKETQLATLVKPFKKEDGFEVLFNPNSPKVVLNKNSEAIYFSRSIIPYIRDAHHTEWLDKHIFYKHIMQDLRLSEWYLVRHKLRNWL